MSDNKDDYLEMLLKKYANPEQKRLETGQEEISYYRRQLENNGGTERPSQSEWSGGWARGK